MCDACEKQPCRIRLHEDIDALLEKLDMIGREFNDDEYGLPMSHQDQIYLMHAEVKSFLASYVSEIASEK